MQKYYNLYFSEEQLLILREAVELYKNIKLGDISPISNMISSGSRNISENCELQNDIRRVNQKIEKIDLSDISADTKMIIELQKIINYHRSRKE